MASRKSAPVGKPTRVPQRGPVTPAAKKAREKQRK